MPVEKPQIAKKPFQFLWVDRLREYLAYEFKPERNTPNFDYDAERAYDDFGEFQLLQCHQASGDGCMPAPMARHAQTVALWPPHWA